MNLQRIRVTVCFGLLGCLLLAGCDMGIRQAKQEAAEKSRTRNDLREFTLLYHSFCDVHSHVPPMNLAEFEEFANQASISQPILQNIRDGKYVVAWGAQVQSYSDGKIAGMPLIFESKVPDQGGEACMGDGVVKTLTAEEFAAAPKFGDTPPQAVASNDSDGGNGTSGTGQAVPAGAYDGPGSVPSTDRKVSATSELYVGMIVQARDAGGWYAADVLAIQPDGQVKIHYRGWSDKWDKAVPLSDLQLAPDDVPQPPKP